MRHVTFIALALAAGLTVGCQQNEPQGGRFAADPPQPEPLELSQSSAPAPTETQPAPQRETPAEAEGEQRAQPERLDMPPAGEATGPTTYTIREGDTLWSIAEEHYGDGQRWQDILDANPGLQPRKMSAGQEIVLPPK